MITTIQAFIDQWTRESQTTQRTLDALTDASLAQSVTHDRRTLGRLAWHITTTVHEMPSRTGLKFEAVGNENEVPAIAAEIAKAYRHNSEALLQAVRTQWTDESLLIMTNMYGDEWPNGLTLHALITHEIHHRGQMTVLMRQAGLQVPEIYGPVYEDWAKFNQAPPVV
jgi:uncharacterized damage-inducible protein DinB